jgi:hypothetical protein
MDGKKKTIPRVSKPSCKCSYSFRRKSAEVGNRGGDWWLNVDAPHVLIYTRRRPIDVDVKDGGMLSQWALGAVCGEERGFGVLRLPYMWGVALPDNLLHSAVSKSTCGAA